MRFFAKEREPRSLIAPDGSLRVAETRPGARVVTPGPQRRTGVLAWLLALGVGAAIAVVAIVTMQDSRSLGTQVDDAVARVKNMGDQAGQTVADSQSAAAEASRTALDGVATAIDDTGISAKVKAALAVDPALSASRIEVQTANGVVRLEGPAPDEAAKARATMLAAAPDGVRSVDNRLVLPQPGNVVAAVPR
ncbi:BON domain-containing protein [Roseateles sp. LYH14W]|uniref:BON domain-containing protein n=1 Tax=Pelomonas parva TaxID=3299032 RepID=A0ABW7F9X2_9BURK